MVERLQDIDEEDAVAEGVEFYEDDVLGIRFKDYMADASGYGDSDVDFPTISTAKQSFQTLWKLINGEKSWEDNPWVWRVEFERINTYIPEAENIKFKK